MPKRKAQPSPKQDKQPKRPRPTVDRGDEPTSYGREPEARPSQVDERPQGRDNIPVSSRQPGNSDEESNKISQAGDQAKPTCWTASSSRGFASPSQSLLQISLPRPYEASLGAAKGKAKGQDNLNWPRVQQLHRVVKEKIDEMPKARQSKNISPLATSESGIKRRCTRSCQPTTSSKGISTMRPFPGVLTLDFECASQIGPSTSTFLQESAGEVNSLVSESSTCRQVDDAEEPEFGDPKGSKRPSLQDSNTINENEMSKPKSQKLSHFLRPRDTVMKDVGNRDSITSNQQHQKGQSSSVGNLSSMSLLSSGHQIQFGGETRGTVDPTLRTSQRDTEEPQKIVEGQMSSNWPRVQELHDLIKTRVDELKWIGGCVMSNDYLEIVTNIPKQEAKKDLREKFKDQPLDFSLLKFCNKPLTMQLLYGPGDSICNITKPDIATVTFVASLNGDSYAFSVGHITSDRAQYYITGNQLPERVVCVGKLNEFDPENPYKKFRDAALFRFEKSVSQKNLTGTAAQRQVTLEKVGAGNGQDMKNCEVLILNNFQENGEQQGVVDDIVDDPTFGFSMWKIRSDRPFKPGQSGSLVIASSKDGNYIGKAFAYIIGYDTNDPKTGMALPLWENLSMVWNNYLDGMDFTDKVVSPQIHLKLNCSVTEMLN